MRQYDIPANPNNQPPPVNPGLQTHWLRIILLVIAISALAAVFPRGQRPSLPALPSLRAASTPAMPSPAPISATAVALPDRPPDFQAILLRANAAFGRARAKADSSSLAGIATGAWLRYEQEYNAQLRKRAATEQWSLTSFAISAVALHEAGAVVCTTERWERALRHADGTTEVLEPLSLAERYILVRQQAGWLIDDIQYPEQACIP